MSSGFYGDAPAAGDDGSSTDSGNSYDPGRDPDPPSSGGSDDDDDDDRSSGGSSGSSSDGVDGAPGFGGDAPAADPGGGSTDDPDGGAGDGGAPNRPDPPSNTDPGGSSDGVDGPPGFGGDAPAADPGGGSTDDLPEGVTNDAPAADPGGGSTDDLPEGVTNDAPAAAPGGGSTDTRAGGAASPSRRSDPQTPREALERAFEATSGDATDSPIGNAIGGGADALFGTDSRDRGVTGDARDRLDRLADRLDRGVADPLREDRGGRTRPVAPGVGGGGSAATSAFVRDSAAETAEMLNPARIGSDLLGIGAAGAQFGDFLADEPDALGQTADAAGDAAAAAPGAAADVVEFVRENPRDAAVTGTGLFVTAGAGAAAGTATRGVASGARRFSSRLDTPGGSGPRGRSTSS